MNVLDLTEVDGDSIALVGGKAAHLGELSRVDGVRVPPGYCVTTAAFRRVVARHPALGELSRLDPDDRDAIAAVSATVRAAVAASPVPDDLAAEIVRPLVGAGAGYAVRSSATAEDLPGASFAGQHDTYLDVVGPAAVLTRVRACWASLFTERAVTYRLRRGVDQHSVAMAVVVQRMVPADASGVLFTADPVTSNRRIVSVEAVRGLGEALVSGLVTPDVWRVRDGHVVSAAIAGERAALPTTQVMALAALGRRIEAHLGCPQDIEWCLDGDGVHIVQSRPITTLFPVPRNEHGGNRVYVSVGHQQMMTDPMTPLGLSIWRMTTPRPMHEAGGRLFVDVTERAASARGRDALLAAFDPLTADALRTVLDGDFLPPPSAPAEQAGSERPTGDTPPEPDADLVEELVAETRASLAAAALGVGTHRGPDLLDAVVDDLRELRRLLFDPRSMRLIMAGLDATTWLNDRMAAWLGEVNAADVLSRSAPGNVTAEMGLALLDVADVIRPHPGVVAFLREVTDDGFLAELPRLAGGRAARDAIRGYLDTYGARCAGEIDIARPRWSERPAVLVPVILGHVDDAEPGARRRRVQRGQEQARAKERELLARLAALPDGEHKAGETRSAIRRLRTVVGFREFPKFGMISRYQLYRQALLDEAGRLVRAGVLREREDIWFLRFDELRDVVRTGRADDVVVRAGRVDDVVRRRREAFGEYGALTPPRVLTSDGEALSGAYRRDDLPAGALAGLAVSTGIVEGRARVVLDMARAELEPGDVLVTTYTDPSWSPVFVAIAALVTEVGGMMTHGAVVAREYGLPAVVGVERATQRIRDGQRLRVDGTSGVVELLA